MKFHISRLTLVGLPAMLALLHATILHAADAPAPMDFSEIGAKASADYQGDAIGVTATPEGASLRTGFQKLSGRVNEEGLWLESTEGEPDALRLAAAAVGRAGSQLYQLPTKGVVTLVDQKVTWTRPGMVEEYSVSVDGVRQDFLLAEPPAGAGELSVELALTGARAEAQAVGARLVFAKSGRELAYSRLLVTDATGRELPARLDVLSPDRLAVRVDDAGAAYPVRIDPTFSDADWVSMNPEIPGTNGTVNATVVDSAGNLYIGGSFTAVGGVLANRIAKWNGTAWTALGSGMSDYVNALAVSGNDLYAGGGFYTAGGLAANSIAKWNGSAWSALGLGVNGRVDALAASSGTLYAGGVFTTAGGVSANNIAKWNGSAWSALGTGIGGVSDPSVRALAVSGGTLYAGGWFGNAGGVAANSIAKWNGSAWSALGSGILGGYSPTVSALAVSGTTLYAGGTFTTAGGVAVKSIAKWNGSAWSALGSGVDNGFGSNGTVLTLAVSGSNLYAGGDFRLAGGVEAIYIAKWNGSAWSGLGSGMNSNSVVKSLSLSGSTVYAGGTFGSAGGEDAKFIAKWNGSAWSALGSGIGGSVRTFALSGSDIYVGGAFAKAGGVTVNNIAKWNGSNWSALGSGLGGVSYPAVLALAVSSTGNLYAGGEFTTAGGIAARSIAKWNGSEWSALGAGANGKVEALAVGGGYLYAGGSFTTAGAMAANYISRWNGLEWSSLGSGMSNTVSALAVSGGDLYAGGTFTTAGGLAVNRIAKWNGSGWSSLGSGMNNSVYTLAVSGGDLYAGGSFTTAGGVVANYVAKWSGSNWSALGSGMGGYLTSVYALAVSGGDLYAGGRFTTAGGVAANGIAKWNGSVWSALGSGVSSSVSALAVSGGNLYVGGSFITAGAQFSPCLAKAFIGARMQVEAPLGNAVPSGGTTSFGQVAQGGFSDMTFTIRNIGQSALNLTGSPRVIVSGADAELFSVTAQPASPLASDEATTLTVCFAPTSLGLKNAQISISSDAETPNYSLLLTGEGMMPPPPVISSAASASAIVGQSFSYQLTASNSPASYGASGLPDGLSVNTTSGLISGTPTAAGTSSITLTATNSGGTGTQILTLTVNEVSNEAIGSWRQEHFGTAENSGNAADLATPDGDGIANLIKYALLMTPGQSGSDQLPRAELQGGRLAIAFQRSPSRNDVSIIVEAQGGLGAAWTEIARSDQGGSFTGPANVTETDAGSGTLNVTVQDTETNALKRFLRVRVERTE